MIPLYPHDIASPCLALSIEVGFMQKERRRCLGCEHVWAHGQLFNRLGTRGLADANVGTGALSWFHHLPLG